MSTLAIEGVKLLYDEIKALKAEIAGTRTDFRDRPMEKQMMKKVTVETFGVEYPAPETV